MPSAQIATPLAMPSQKRGLRLVTSGDLYAGLHAGLATQQLNNDRPSTPVRGIQEHDYTVPAPPPPSPVSFRPEHWPVALHH